MANNQRKRLNFGTQNIINLNIIKTSSIMLKHLLNLALCAMLSTSFVQAQYVSVDCPGASAGTPVGPTNNTANCTSAAPSFIPPATADWTNYAFIITEPPVGGVPGNIVDISYDGVYDFSGVEVSGEYGFTGFAYKNDQLATVAGLLCALGPSFIQTNFGVTLETAQQIVNFLCVGSQPQQPVTLDKLFGLLNLVAGVAQPLDSVAVQLNAVAGSTLVNVCYASTVSPAYTINVSANCVTVGVQSINGFDNIAVLPTLATDRLKISGNVSKAQDLTIELTDLTGRKLATYRQQATIGDFSYDIDLDGNLPKGYLLCTIRSNEGVHTAKVLRQ